MAIELAKVQAELTAAGMVVSAVGDLPGDIESPCCLCLRQAWQCVKVFQVFRYPQSIHARTICTDVHVAYS